MPGSLGACGAGPPRLQGRRGGSCGARSAFAGSSVEERAQNPSRERLTGTSEALGRACPPTGGFWAN
eukprot:2139351-Pyramimonas_sp.AAC.1